MGHDEKLLMYVNALQLYTFVVTKCPIDDFDLGWFIHFKDIAEELVRFWRDVRLDSQGFGKGAYQYICNEVVANSSMGLNHKDGMIARA